MIVPSIMDTTHTDASREPARGRPGSSGGPCAFPEGVDESVDDGVGLVADALGRVAAFERAYRLVELAGPLPATLDEPGPVVGFEDLVASHDQPGAAGAQLAEVERDVA